MHWNWTCHTLALRFFLSRLRKFPILNRFSSKIFWEGELIKYFGTPANHYVFDALTCKLASLVELRIWHLIYFQLINSKITRVALWQIKTETPEAWGVNSHFPLFTLSTPLGSKRSTLSSAQLYPAGVNGSDKTDQDIEVGIFNGGLRNYTYLDVKSVRNTRDNYDYIGVLFFLSITIDNSDNFYFNKVLLCWLPCCSILQSNRHY